MEKKVITTGEILILLIGVFAFSVVLSTEFVSAVGCKETCKAQNFDEGYDLGKKSDCEEGYQYVPYNCCCKEKIEGESEYGKKEAGLSLTGILKKFGLSEEKARFSSMAIQDLGVASTIYFGTRTTLRSLGVSDGTSDAISAGLSVWDLSHRVLGEGGWLSKIASKSGWIADKIIANANWISFSFGVAVFLAKYKKTETEKIVFDCKSWEPPSGGKKCEECNNELFGCSPYQCESLGKKCEFVEGKCVYNDESDHKYPVIKLDEEALLKGFKYEKISNTGYNIVNENLDSGCAKPSTPLSFGIKTDEAAYCRMSGERKENFEDMIEFPQGFSYTHSIDLGGLPSPDAINSENSEAQADGKYEVYIRCRDKNENENPSDIVFKFCIEQGPDLEPPIIVATNPYNDGSSIPHGISSIADFKIYVNKVSDCKWSHKDQDYDTMEYSMNCAESVYEMNLQTLYPCSTTLTGLESEKENKFYFRCKSYPQLEESKRRANTQSMEFTLKGTQPLVIDDVGPTSNEIIKGQNKDVKVTLTAKTIEGAENGYSICSYSETGVDGSYVPFYDTDSYAHSQDLYLPSGKYTYYIRCIDIGGNSADAIVSFETQSDEGAPKVVRIYKQGTSLKFITSEEAECVYSEKDCGYSFGDGIQIKTLDSVEHSLEWQTNSNYYIKCKDSSGNGPDQEECSIKIRASDF